MAEVSTAFVESVFMMFQLAFPLAKTCANTRELSNSKLRISYPLSENKLFKFNSKSTFSLESNVSFWNSPTPIIRKFSNRTEALGKLRIKLKLKSSKSTFASSLAFTCS